VKLKLAESAQRQAARIEAWWAEHRPAAPSLFAREFRDTLAYLESTPSAGTRWPTQRRPDLMRILMPRTKHHVYFRVERDRDGLVLHVLAVWGAPRGRGPRL